MTDHASARKHVYKTDSGIPYGWYAEKRAKGLEALAKAIAKEPPPPCAGCPNNARCAANERACLDFATYLEINRVELRKKYLDKPRKATKAIYKLCFEVRCSKRGCYRTAMPPFLNWGARIDPVGGFSDACPKHREV